jgi:hypothetical protein
MAYIAEFATSDVIQDGAQKMANDGVKAINEVITDISIDGILVDNAMYHDYGVTISGSLNISSAAGAMVIDDLMQKISTKVQVAAQLLSGNNNLTKTASRILGQG